MRHVISILLLGLAMHLSGMSAGSAQDTGLPILEVELSETQVLPGQPVSMRITILVPTWLSKPVEFPSFEAPDLMVKLFEGATNPTSRSISGETWSGISRVYQLSPLVAGNIRVLPQDILVLWADPGKTDPLRSVLKTEEFIITGVVPAEAMDLDPFFAATAVELEQEISPDTQVLQAGDSVTRTVTIRVSGASPFALPVIMPPHDIRGIAVYPTEPVLVEEAGEQWLSGSRTESVTLLAESGGSGAAPSIELRWFNLQSGEVETARLDGFELTVDAPAAWIKNSLDAGAIGLILMVAAASGLLAFLSYRFVLPLARISVQRRKAARRASEAWAFDEVRTAIARQDYSAFVRAADVWAARAIGPDKSPDAELSAAMMELGACIYGKTPDDPAAAWNALNKAFLNTRKRIRGNAAQPTSFSNVSINPTFLHARVGGPPVKWTL
jgi:hypothetical protein